MSITYRRLTKDDLDLFFSFFKQMIKHEFPEYSPELQVQMITQPEMWNRDTYVARFDDKNKYFLGAFDGETLVGCIEASGPFGGISYCSWLLVDGTHQKQGIGEHLLATWESWATEKSAHGIYLYTLKRNEAYYNKMGFTLIGIFPKAWFGHDNYIFVKHLS